MTTARFGIGAGMASTKTITPEERFYQVCADILRRAHMDLGLAYMEYRAARPPAIGPAPDVAIVDPRTGERKKIRRSK